MSKEEEDAASEGALPPDRRQQLSAQSANDSAKYGPTAYYVHIMLLGAVISTNTNFLSCICSLAFLFYATRPPVGKNLMQNRMWTPPAWYWVLLVLAGLESITGSLVHCYLQEHQREFDEHKWLRFVVGGAHAPHTRLEFVTALLAPALLVVYSIGVLTLPGDTKGHISEAYQDVIKMALQTIKDRVLVSTQAEVEAERFTWLGFLLSNSGYVLLFVAGFIHPSWTSLFYAIMLLYAIFVHAVSVDLDTSRFWSHYWFWVIVQLVCGVVLFFLLLVQYFHLFDRRLPVWYPAFGIQFFAPYEPSKWVLYVFLCSQYMLYTSASHHRLVKEYEEQKAGASPAGGYGTFADSEQKSVNFWVEFHKSWNFLVSHSHQFCGLALLFWSLMVQSLATSVLLVASFAAWFIEGRHFAMLGPFLLAYCVVFLSLQLAYNVPGVSQYVNQDNEWMTLVGFRRFAHIEFDMVLQLALACLIALYVHASQQIDAHVSNLSTTLASLGADAPGARNDVTSNWTKLKLLASFVFSNAFVVTLITAYVYAISEISLLNTGFMLLALFFFCFPHLAQQGWLVIVVYSQLVILVLYCWQFAPAEYVLTGWSAEETGLHLYPVPWRGEKPNLWTTDKIVQSETPWLHVLGMPVFILLFALMQHTIFANVKEHLKGKALMEGLQTPPALGEAMEREVPIVLKATAAMGLIMEEFCSSLAFASILVMVTVGPPNLINLGYLLLIFLLCLSYSPYGHGRRRLYRLVWSLVMLYTALVLMAQYAMEFPMRHADGTERDAWKWIGFVRTTLSRIALFLPTTCTLLLSLYHVKILDDDPDTTYQNDTPRRLDTEMPMLQTMSNFLKRFAVLHMGKIFVIFLVVCAVAHPGLFGFVMLLYAVVDLFFLSRGGLPRVPMMVLSFAYFVAEYTCQFAVYGTHPPLTATVRDPDISTTIHKLAAWARFAKPGEATEGIQTAVWTWVIGALASSAVQYWTLEVPEEGKTVFRDRGDPCLLFLRQQESLGEPFQKLREHLNDFFAKHGILITLTTMIVAACARTNVASFFYVSISTLSLYCSHESLARNSTLWSTVFVILSSYLLFEFLMVWNPQLSPLSGGIDEYSADGMTPLLLFGLHIPKAYMAWFCIEVSSKWYLLADFAAVFVAALQARTAWLPRPGPSPLEFDDTDMDTGDVFDRMLVGAIRIFICNYSPTFVTLTVAVVGGMEVTMVNSVYLFIALMFLSYGNMLMRTRNPWWVFLRVYNMLLLTLGRVA